MIQIHQPRIEALIQQRLTDGGFKSVDDVLIQALTDAPLPVPNESVEPTGTGADIVAAFQRSPFKDIDIDFERLRSPMPVRNFEF